MDGNGADALLAKYGFADGADSVDAEPNGDADSLLSKYGFGEQEQPPKEEGRALGFTERHGTEYAAQTGVDIDEAYGEGSALGGTAKVLTSVAPFAGTAGRAIAGARQKSLDSALESGEAGLLSAIDTDEWDKTEGAKYDLYQRALKGETGVDYSPIYARKRDAKGRMEVEKDENGNPYLDERYSANKDDARKAYVKELAAEQIEDIARTKGAAQKNLANNAAPWYMGLAHGATGSLGFAGEFMLGGALAKGVLGTAALASTRLGKAAQLAEKGAKLGFGARTALTAAELTAPTVAHAIERYENLTADDYRMDDAGNVTLAEKGDGVIRGATKAVAGAAFENATEVALGKIVNKVFGATMKGVYRKVPGVKKLFDGAVGKLGETNINRARVAWTRAAQTYAKVQNAVHFELMPAGEFAEEYVQGWGDDVVGLNLRKDAENKSFGDFTKDFFDWDAGGKDLFFGVMGQSIALGLGGYAGQRGKRFTDSLDSKVVGALKLQGYTNADLAKMSAATRIALAAQSGDKAAEAVRGMGYDIVELARLGGVKEKEIDAFKDACEKKFGEDKANTYDALNDAEKAAIDKQITDFAAPIYSASYAFREGVDGATELMSHLNKQMQKAIGLAEERQALGNYKANRTSKPGDFTSRVDWTGSTDEAGNINWQQDNNGVYIESAPIGDEGVGARIYKRGDKFIAAHPQTGTMHIADSIADAHDWIAAADQFAQKKNKDREVMSEYIKFNANRLVPQQKDKKTGETLGAPVVTANNAKDAANKFDWLSEDDKRELLTASEDKTEGGGYKTKDGTVIMFLDNLTGADDALFTLAHEIGGHLAIAAGAKEKNLSLTDTVAEVVKGSETKDVAQGKREFKIQKMQGKTSQEATQIAQEEAMVYGNEYRMPTASPLQKAKTAVKLWMKKHGMDAKLTDEDYEAIAAAGLRRIRQTRIGGTDTQTVDTKDVEGQHTEGGDALQHTYEKGKWVSDYYAQREKMEQARAEMDAKAAEKMHAEQDEADRMKEDVAISTEIGRPFVAEALKGWFSKKKTDLAKIQRIAEKATDEEIAELMDFIELEMDGKASENTVLELAEKINKEVIKRNPSPAQIANQQRFKGKNNPKHQQMKAENAAENRLLDKFIDEVQLNPNSALAFWREKGHSLFAYPQYRRVANKGKGNGFRFEFVGADGNSIDALNNLFNGVHGMKSGDERAKLVRLIFGKNAKPGQGDGDLVTDEWIRFKHRGAQTSMQAQADGDVDVTADEDWNNAGNLIDRFLEEYAKYEEWKNGDQLTAEEQALKDQIDAENEAIDKENAALEEARDNWGEAVATSADGKPIADPSQVGVGSRVTIGSDENGEYTMEVVGRDGDVIKLADTENPLMEGETFSYRWNKENGRWENVETETTADEVGQDGDTREDIGDAEPQAADGKPRAVGGKDRGNGAAAEAPSDWFDSEGALNEKGRSALQQTEMGKAILGNYDANVGDDREFAIEQLKRSVKNNAEDISAQNDSALSLESVSAKQIEDEEKSRAQKAEIERRANAPLKGGVGEVGQTLMDLGGAEGEDLFNRTGKWRRDWKSGDRSDDAWYKLASTQGVDERAVRTAWKSLGPNGAKDMVGSFHEKEGAGVQQEKANSLSSGKWRRTKKGDEPKNTAVVYKLMRLVPDRNGNPRIGENGKPLLQTLYIGREDYEVGQWYDGEVPDVSKVLADEPSGFAYLIDGDNRIVERKVVKGGSAKISGLPSKDDVLFANSAGSRWITKTLNAKGKVSYANVGINGSEGVTTFAMRPGIHAGSLPSMQQIGIGEKRNLRADNLVWVRGRVDFDPKYESVVKAEGGEINDRMPEHGYVKGSSSFVTKGMAWYISPKFIADEIISDSEAERVMDEFNRTRDKDGEDVGYDYPRSKDMRFYADTMKLEPRRKDDVTDHTKHNISAVMKKTGERWNADMSVGKPQSLIPKAKDAQGKAQGKWRRIGTREDGIPVYKTDGTNMGPKATKLFVEGNLRGIFKDRPMHLVTPHGEYDAVFGARDTKHFLRARIGTDAEGYNARLDSSFDNDAFDIVNGAKFVANVKDDGSHGAAAVEWDYFKNRIQFNGKVFDLLINVRKDKRGEHFVYDIQFKYRPDIEARPAYENHTAWGTQNARGRMDEAERDSTSDATVATSAQGAQGTPNRRNKGIIPKAREGAQGGKWRRNTITPEMDAAYADAVKRGDKEVALRMIRAAAAKAMPNTKVVDKDGLPKIMYHYGLIGVDGLSDEDLPLDAESSFVPTDNQHFGTYRQAAHRQFQLMSEGAWQSEHGEIKKFFLDIRNPKKTKDGWGLANDPNVGCNVRHEGYDGNRYKNKVEGEGEESWMAYHPSQIKSADITYDDDGNLIPLSERFNSEKSDIRWRRSYPNRPDTTKLDELRKDRKNRRDEYFAALDDYSRAKKEYVEAVVDWAKDAPDVLSFITDDGADINLVSKNNADYTDRWRVSYLKTNYPGHEGEHYPMGHTNYKTKDDAVRAAVEDGEHHYEDGAKWRRRYTPNPIAQQLANLRSLRAIEGAFLAKSKNAVGADDMAVLTKMAREIAQQGSVNAEVKDILDAIRDDGNIGFFNRKNKGLEAALARRMKDEVKTKLQDAMLADKQLEESLGIKKEDSAYHQFDRNYGLEQERMDDLEREVKIPLEKLLRKLDKTFKREIKSKDKNGKDVTHTETAYGLLGMFLMAKHGGQRNRWMAERNPFVQEAMKKSKSRKIIDEVLAGTRDLDEQTLADIGAALGWTNEKVRQIDKGLRGSGATTAFWNQWLNENAKFANDADAEAARQLVLKMNKMTRDILVSSGRLSAAQAAEWERLSPDYVPLRSDMGVDSTLWAKVLLGGGDGRVEGANGHSYANNEFHHAYGRNDIADDPIAFSVQQYAEAVRRSLDNNARRKFADIVRANPNLGKVFEFVSDADRKDLARRIAILNNVAKKRLLTTAELDALNKMHRRMIDANLSNALIPRDKVLGANGIYHEVANIAGIEHDKSNENDDRTPFIAFKQDGNLHFVRLGGFTQDEINADKNKLSDSDAKKIATQIKKQNLVHAFGADTMRKFTGLFSALRTAYSPYFMLTNLFADRSQAKRNIYATFGKEGVEKFRHYQFNSFGAAKKVLGDKDGKRNFDLTKKIDSHAKDWAENGGRIAGMAVENIRELRKALIRDVSRIGRRNIKDLLGDTDITDAKSVMRFLKDVGINGMDCVEYWNSVVEMSTRIAAYATCRDMGYSIADAVSYSRDVTVNFNRKGEWTPTLNGYIAFFNAGIQDIARSFEAFGEGEYLKGSLILGKRGAKMALKLAILGFIFGLIGHWQDDPDDEKEGKRQYKYNKEWEKANKMGIRVGDYTVGIPIRGMARIPYYFGQKVADVVMGPQRIHAAAWDLTKLALGTGYDVMGGAPTPLQAITPSVFKPAAELIENKDFTGRQIYRKDFFGNGVKSEMGRSATSDEAKGFARFVNWATGGDETKSGFIDWQPEIYEKIAEWAGGTAMRDVVQTFGAAKDLLTGRITDRKLRNMPLVNRFIRTVGENSTEFYEKQGEYERKRQRFDKLVEHERMDEAQEMVDENHYLAGRGRGKRYGDELKSIASDIRNLMEMEKSATGDEYDDIHQKRLKSQYQFMRRLTTPPEEDAEGVKDEKAHKKNIGPILKAKKKDEKKGRREEKRNKRGLIPHAPR